MGETDLDTSMEVLTTRKKRKFMHGGYLYIFDRFSLADKDVKFWRCEKKDTCKARLHTRGESVLKAVNGHTHEASPESVEAALLTSTIKRMAENSLEKPGVIISECLANVSQDSIDVAKQIARLRNTIRRVRKQKLEPNEDSVDEEQAVAADSITIPNGTSTPFTPKKIRKTEQPTMDSRLERLNEIVEKTIVREDCFDNFGKYVAAQLRVLPLRESILLQQEIQNAITQAIVTECDKGAFETVPVVEEATSDGEECIYVEY